MCACRKGWKNITQSTVALLHVLTPLGETASIHLAQLFVLNDFVSFRVADLGEIRWTRAHCSVVNGVHCAWPFAECVCAAIFEWFAIRSFFHFRSATKFGRKSSKESTKEATEKERPPWRTVIVAAPQKVNKNALLKAKILDATRRALLAQKICHIGIQTEPTTTLVREQSIDVQTDLIRKMDKSMDTDGVVTIRRECPQGCMQFRTRSTASVFIVVMFIFSVIITHTVGQMTEKSLGSEIGTQTPLPTTSLNFSLLRPMHSAVDEDAEHTFDVQLKRNEIILRNQADALRQFDAELNGTEANRSADEQSDSLESTRMERNSVNFTLFYDN